MICLSSLLSFYYLESYEVYAYISEYIAFFEILHNFFVDDHIVFALSLQTSFTTLLSARFYLFLHFIVTVFHAM